MYKGIFLVLLYNILMIAIIVLSSVYLTIHFENWKFLWFSILTIFLSRTYKSNEKGDIDDESE